MSLQKCSDISEAMPLEAGLGLYLKPASKIKISVQLPKLKTPGQSISTFQVMTKLKAAVRPDQFLSLKALKITSVVIKFLGELETRSASERALARLQAAASLKLPGFSESLQIRAAHAASVGPTRHDWDSFFRDARGVDEMKPGERPDTVHLQDLPARWFSEFGECAKPSEVALRKAFSTFGRIRRLEIPSPAERSSEMFGKTSTLSKDLTFEVYVQFEEYVEFATAMDALRGKKLLWKDPSDGKVYATEIKVDFDRTNYLSDRNIKKRALEEAKRTSVSAPHKAETSCSQDEEKNPSVLTTQYDDKTNSSHEDVRREAKSLLKELLLRSEASEREKEAKKRLAQEAELEKKEMARRERKKQEKLLQQEQILKEKLIRTFKAKEQERIEKLRKQLAGRKLLSVLANCRTGKKYS